MKALSPWSGFEALRKDMERFFDRFGDWEERSEFGPLADWSPKLDVSETKDGYVVKAEIPGLDPKEIEVALDNQVLTLKGEKKQEKEDKDEHYYRVERSYGTFVRTVRLPGAVNGEKVNATFKNGLLTVTLPKAAGAKAAAIPINAA